MSEVFKHLGMGEFPSAREYNRLVDAVSGLLKASGVQYFVDSRGLHVRRMPDVRVSGEHILMRHIGAEVIPDSTATLIPINTIIADPRGWYDSGNFGFIAPSDGIYFTSSAFTVQYGNHVDIRAEVSVRINGGFRLDSTRSYTPTVGFGGASVSWGTYGMMELEAGDLVQFFFWHSAGGGNTMTVASGGHGGMWIIR